MGYQFSAPSRHSWRSPAVRISRNRNDAMVVVLMFMEDDRGIGIRRTISMSNTRKITARRKKRRENGIRADDFGSKPHSNGVDFSRLVFFFLDRIKAASMTTIGKIRAIVII